MKPSIVFIGGTGRSGTNILKDIFARHSWVHTLPFEHRFFIDPDGLVDFYSSFTESWSPYMATVRIQRLEKLLSNVSDIGGKAYNDWELSKHFPNFDEHNDRLINQLIDFTYMASWPGQNKFDDSSVILHSGYKTKEVLARIIGDYIQNLINDLLRTVDAHCFVEDNTWNILHARQLLEFVPDAKIIHIHRDPMDTICSMAKQRWCPSDVVDAAKYYKSIMDYWVWEVKPGIPNKNEQLRELDLLELCTWPAVIVQDLCEFIGIPFEKHMIDIDLSGSNPSLWEDEFTDEEKVEVAKIIIGS